MPSEFAEDEGTLTAHVRGNIEATKDGKVSANSSARRATDRQDGAGRNLNCLPQWNRSTVDGRPAIRTRDGDHCGSSEAQSRPHHRELESGGGLRIAHDPI